MSGELAFFGISTATIQSFMLVMARISGLFMIAPIFGSKSIPVQLKVAFSVVLAFTLWPLVGARAAMSADGLVFVGMLASELLIGFAMGYLVVLIFSAVQVAGEMIDTAVGFALAQLMDPLTQFNTTVMGQIYYVLAILMFFALNGHHFLITGLARSFSAVPLGEAQPSPEFFGVLTRGFGDIFVIGVAIAAPVLVAMLVTDVFLGIVARAMPRFNVFFVGFPFRAAVGIAFVAISFGVALPYLDTFFGQGFRGIEGIIGAVR